MRPVVSGKLAYIRFDRNSYSIPHTHVRRPLTLLASATTVRVVEGAEEIARHGRSYDTGATIEDAAHLDRLLTATRQANESSTRDRLRLAVPITTTMGRRNSRAPSRSPSRATPWAPARSPTFSKPGGATAATHRPCR
jgi:hypothetical protein